MSADPSSSPEPLFWARSDDGRQKQPQAHAMKLINVNKGKLEMAKDGISLLRSLSPTSALNLAFCFGNARSGKSFLMNCLSGTPGLFRVINSSTPCTKGVDISSRIMSHSTFQAHVDRCGIDVSQIQLQEEDEENQQRAGSGPSNNGSTGNKSKIELGWVDAEGQGAEDNAYDTMLALPLLLTSKVILFNHKGAPTVSDMLSRLGVLARAADYVAMGGDDNDAPTADDDGNGRSRRASSSASPPPPPPSFAQVRAEESGGRAFGHLHVIFRDFSFSGDEKSVYSQLMGLEHVPAPRTRNKSTPTKTLGGGAPGSASKNDADREFEAIRAIQERNDIRSLLMQHFSSIHVWLLKQPADADTLKAHAELPESCVDEEFKIGIQRLSAVLSSQLSTPTRFHGADLTGERTCSLLQQICNQLNTHGSVSVPSVFGAMENESVQRIMKEQMERIQRRGDELKQALPMASSAIRASLDSLRFKVLASFDSALAECSLDKEKQSARDELLSTLTRLGHSIQSENSTLLLRLIAHTVSQATTQTKSAFERFCTSKIPVDEPRTLEEEMTKLKTELRSKIEETLGSHLEDARTTPEYNHALLTSEEELMMLLSHKLTINDAALKAVTIQRLQAEAIRQQQILIEQNKRLEVLVSEEKDRTEELENTLQRLREERQQEQQRMERERKRNEELSMEIERLRKEKRKKDCVIL